MKPVPKPEGFEMRDKRSTKSNKASDWTPSDALYSASTRIAGKRVDDLVVYWWEVDEGSGDRILRFAQSSTSPAEHCYLLHSAITHAVR